MKVLIFGATGMVGQGVLRECLQADDVALVQTVGRTPTGQQRPRLRELVRADLFDYTGIEADLTGFDACFFCLGVSASGLSEKTYTHITFDLAVAAAAVLAPLNPGMVFVYVSGAGADSSEKSRIMWERVRGKTENALLQQPFRSVVIFRPGMIQPLDGTKSKTAAYRIFYTLARPLLPLLRAALPQHVLTTRQLGQGMLTVARTGATKRVLESVDIAKLQSAQVR